MNSKVMVDLPWSEDNCSSDVRFTKVFYARQLGRENYRQNSTLNHSFRHFSPKVTLIWDLFLDDFRRRNGQTVMEREHKV